MVTKEQIEQAVSSRIHRILSVAEVALPDRQFEAFKKIIFDEFGNSGFKGDLTRIFRDQEYKER